MNRVPQVTLGSTALQVSKLCYGTLTMGPLQRDLSPEQGAALLKHAFDNGINFLDTAQIYGTYPHIRELIRTVPRRKLVIMTKSYAWSVETAQAAVSEALKALGTDYIDIFLMHEQESEHTLRGHDDALQEYLRMKKQGMIRAVGLSTHRIEAVRASLKRPEIEVLFPIFNPTGIGIHDGTIREMELALEAARLKGKAVIGMKALGGGHLLTSYEASLQFSLRHPLLDAVAVGMQSRAEIDANITLAAGRPLSEAAKYAALSKSRKLHIGDECTGCGNCVFICRQRALELDGRQAAVDHERCILCSYCARKCPEFCIKVI